MIPNMFKIAGELTPAVDPRRGAHGRDPRALDLRRPQRRDGRPHDGLGHAGRRLGAGGPRPRARRARRDAPRARPVPALLRRLPHLATRSTRSTCSARTTSARSSTRTTSSRTARARPDARTRPVLRGTAQNPDVFFQAREAANPFHDAVPGDRRRASMDALAERTGRRYGLVDYVGAPDAERVVVADGLGRPAPPRRPSRPSCAAGEKVGLLRRAPLPPVPGRRAARRAARRPCASIAVLDRTKEPGRRRRAALPGRRRRRSPRHGRRRRAPFAMPARHRRSLRARRRRSSRRRWSRPSSTSSPPSDRAPLHGRHRRRRHAPQPADATAGSVPRPDGEVAGRLLRARRRRHRRRQQDLGQDHRRAHRPVRPGLLRLRLEEVRRGHRLAPALRPAARSARPT